MIIKGSGKTPYELLKGWKPVINDFHAFGSKCFVHSNGKTYLKTFDERADEEIFLGYSLTSKAFKVFNKRILVVEESIHVFFDEKINVTTPGDQAISDVQVIPDHEKSELCITTSKEETYRRSDPSFVPE